MNDYPQPHAKSISNRFAYCVGSVLMMLALALSGCGGEVQAKLDDYLEELEFDTPLDSVIEVQLGMHHNRGVFRVSVPARKRDVRSRNGQAMWVQIKFELFVVVAPEHEKAVRAAVERHQGMIDDVIGGICRKLSIEEMDDSRLVTLKAKIIDSLRPLLGEERVAQVIFNDFQWEPL